MKQKQEYPIVVLLTCMMALLANAMSGSAVAGELYSWTDENGVVHYGDVPPNGQTAQIIKDRETRAPGAAGTAPGPDGNQPDAAIEDDEDGTAASPPQSFADQRREMIAKSRKEQREAQAEVERMCAKHSERLAGVEPRRRIFYTDENGESIRMDDDERTALVEESRDFIAKNCD